MWKVTVIDKGKARKCPEMEKPENFDSYKGQSILPQEMINYGKHIQSLPIFSCPPEWQVGSTKIEGVDFREYVPFCKGESVSGNCNHPRCGCESVLVPIEAEKKSSDRISILYQRLVLLKLIPHLNHESKKLFRKEIELFAGSSQEGEGWVSVKDKLPPFGEWVLVYCRIYGRYIGSYQRILDTGHGNWHDGKQLGVLPPTHWMPLPQPPNPGK